MCSQAEWRLSFKWNNNNSIEKIRSQVAMWGIYYAWNVKFRGKRFHQIENWIEIYYYLRNYPIEKWFHSSIACNFISHTNFVFCFFFVAILTVEPNDDLLLLIASRIQLFLLNASWAHESRCAMTIKMVKQQQNDTFDDNIRIEIGDSGLKKNNSNSNTRSAVSNASYT